METKPKRRFKTNEDGKVSVPLLPDTVYVAEMPERKSATRLATHTELADWIEQCVLGDLRTLRLGIEAYRRERSPSFGEGNFLLLASSLMALEYVSKIYSTKKDATSCVKEYSQKWLVAVNAKYESAWKVLWLSGRHGIVHGSWPHRLALENDPNEYRFAIGCESADPHLVCFERSISVNASIFLDDFAASIANGFSAWLRASTDPKVLERGQPRVHVISSQDGEATDALRQITSWRS